MDLNIVYIGTAMAVITAVIALIDKWKKPSTAGYKKSNIIALLIFLIGLAGAFMSYFSARESKKAKLASDALLVQSSNKLDSLNDLLLKSQSKIIEMQQEQGYRLLLNSTIQRWMVSKIEQDSAYQAQSNDIKFQTAFSYIVGIFEPMSYGSYVTLDSSHKIEKLRELIRIAKPRLESELNNPILKKEKEFLQTWVQFYKKLNYIDYHMSSYMPFTMDDIFGDFNEALTGFSSLSGSPRMDSLNRRIKSFGILTSN